MKQIALIILSFFLFSCNNKSDIKEQPTILEKNCGFDFEKINFNENVSKLFSENPFENHILFYEDSITKKIPDSVFRYKIESYLADEFKLKLPKNNLGFLYKTQQLDSVAKLDNVYSESIWTLTNANKKPIAYYTEARLNTKKEKDSFIKNLKNKLGVTKYEFLIDSHYNQCSYEWQLSDRTIQIETSKGQEMSISTDNPEAISSEYYRIDILIIENKFKETIYKAHILELPEKFALKGKIDTTITFTEKDLENLNLKKINIIKDEFLLNSYFDEYVKDEYGTHLIGVED